MPQLPENITIKISPGSIITAILFILLVAVLFYLQNLVLIILTAIVLASAIEPAASWFIRYRVPRPFAVLIVYLLIFIFAFGVFYFFIPPVIDEVTKFLSALPRYIELINTSTILPEGSFFDGGGVTQGVSETVNQLSVRDLVEQIRATFQGTTEGLFNAISGIFGGLLSFILIIILSFYFAVLETGVDDFLRVITPVKHERYIVNLWKRSQVKIGRWMQGQIILALIIGVLVYLGLMILDIRFALLLAVLAAIFELIPVFGPILAAIPAVIVALVDGGATMGLIVIGLYAIIQQFENHLIYPLVVKKVVGVPPLLVIIALIVGAQLAGFLGVLLSVPVAAVIQEFVGDIQTMQRRRRQELSEQNNTSEQSK